MHFFFVFVKHKRAIFSTQLMYEITQTPNAPTTSRMKKKTISFAKYTNIELTSDYSGTIIYLSPTISIVSTLSDRDYRFYLDEFHKKIGKSHTKLLENTAFRMSEKKEYRSNGEMSNYVYISFILIIVVFWLLVAAMRESVRYVCVCVCALTNACVWRLEM